jgi:hypothetical protein
MDAMTNAKSKRILIVDDEKRLVFFLGENLAALGTGCEVKTAWKDIATSPSRLRSRN